MKRNRKCSVATIALGGRKDEELLEVEPGRKVLAIGVA